MDIEIIVKGKAVCGHIITVNLGKHNMFMLDDERLAFLMRDGQDKLESIANCTRCIAKRPNRTGR